MDFRVAERAAKDGLKALAPSGPRLLDLPVHFDQTRGNNLTRCSPNGAIIACVFVCARALRVCVCVCVCVCECVECVHSRGNLTVSIAPDAVGKTHDMEMAVRAVRAAKYGARKLDPSGPS
jgi:hypothetical protein